MTDFQLALGGIILAIIVGVIAYNRWQEYRYRKHAERAFGSRLSGSDALLDSTTVARSARTEPTMGGVSALPSIDDMPDLTPIGDPGDPTLSAARAAPLAAAPSVPRESALGIQAEIDCVALVLADQPIVADTYHELRDALLLLDRRVICEGLVDGLWQPIDENSEESFRELRAGLQLASRGGATQISVIEQFLGLVGAFAERIGAVSQREDALTAFARAQQLDTFCAETDVEIAVNITGKNGVTFAPTKVRGLAEANGFTPLESGEYLYRDELGRALFVLRNGDPAEPPGIRGGTPYFTTLTLSLDVPRAPQPVQAFERLFALALQFADVLQGDLVDDNRKLLTTKGRTAIAEAIRDISARMSEHGVVAGTPAALRLYA